MKKMSKTSIIGWIILISAIGIGLEILFNWRLLIPLLIGCFLIYKGKHSNKKRNVYLIFGFFLIAISIFSSGFLKFLIIISIVYGLHEFYKVKKQPYKMIVKTVEPEAKPVHMKKKAPYFKNMFSGSRRNVIDVFEWDDINIQCGFGDTIIDLGMTMLPQGESVVMIRSFISNIQILVPFDAAVIVNHSTISGKLKVFEEEIELFNSNMIYYPESDQQSLRTIKIITNVTIGNIEVKRI